MGFFFGRCEYFQFAFRPIAYNYLPEMKPVPRVIIIKSYVNTTTAKNTVISPDLLV